MAGGRLLTIRLYGYRKEDILVPPRRALVSLLIALTGGLALLAAPALAAHEDAHISGWLYQDFRLEFGGDDNDTQLLIHDPWLRLIIGGDLYDRFSFHLWLIENEPPEPGEEEGDGDDEAGHDAPGRPLGLLFEAAVTAHLTPNLDVTAGRQNIYWTFLGERFLNDDPVFGEPMFPGFVQFTAPALSFDYRTGPLTLSGFYTPEAKEEEDDVYEENTGKRLKPFSRERAGARAVYTTGVGGWDARLGIQLVVDFREAAAPVSEEDGPESSGEDLLGWGVQGALGRRDLLTVYGEYGQPDADTKEKFWVVGSRLHFLEPMGITAFLERDIARDESHFEVAKQVNDYLHLIFGGDTGPDEPGDDEWTLYFVVRTGLAFGAVEDDDD